MSSKAPKANLAAGQRVRVSDGDPSIATPGLGASAPVIRTGETKEALPKRAGRHLAGLLTLIVVLLFVLYTILAVTVLVVMRADGHNVLVLRGAFPIGQAPAGAYAYVSSEPVDYSLLGKVKQATVGMPAGSVVQIVAGPNGAIANGGDGLVYLDNQPTKFHVPVAPTTLVREYVAVCVTGACTPGHAVLIGQNNIVGGVKGYLTTSGVTQPTTPSLK